MSADPDQQKGARKLVRPLEAVLRRPILAMLPVIVLTSVLVLVQLVAPAKYSAEGNLVFGSVDVAPNQLPGLVTAGQQLAATYARFLPATVPQVADRMDMSEGEVRAALEATNVAQSPVITISAVADSQKDAIRLVEVTMEEFKTYVDDFSGTSAYRDPEVIRDEKTALTKSEFAKAVVERDQARVRLNRLNGQVGAPGGAGLDTDIGDAVESLVEKQGVVDEIQAELDRLDSEQNSATDSDPLAATVRPLSDPVGTGADTSGRLITSIAAGLVLGGLLGVALAMMSANNWNILDPEEVRTPKSTKSRRSENGESGEAGDSGDSGETNSGGAGSAGTRPTEGEPRRGRSERTRTTASTSEDSEANRRKQQDKNRSRKKRQRVPAKAPASGRAKKVEDTTDDADSVDISDSKSGDSPTSAKSATNG